MPAPSIFDLGTIELVSSLRADLDERIQRRKLEYPAAFREATGWVLDTYPHQKALVLLGDTAFGGDLTLDWTPEFEQNEVVAIIARGNLDVKGTVRNTNLDGGPLLFVDGNLTARHLDKGGAPIVVLGDLKLSGVGLCEYNHGALRVAGNLDAPLFLSIDHDAMICGKTRGVFLSDGDDFREVLVPEVFDLADDPDAEWPDTTRLRRHIAEGRPILKRPK